MALFLERLPVAPPLYLLKVKACQIAFQWIRNVHKSLFLGCRELCGLDFLLSLLGWMIPKLGGTTFSASWLLPGNRLKL